MHTHRKILMGVFALALPLGTMVVLSPTALAKKPPPNPIICDSFGATVTFQAPISKPGVATAAKIAAPTLISAPVLNCGGGTANGHAGALTVPGAKNPKLAKTDPRYVKGSPVKYAAGTQGTFVSGGAKLIKKGLKVINFTINSQPTQFKMKTATEVVGGACPGEVGFVLAGQVKVGTYNTKEAEITACLGQDSGAGTVNSFGVDLFSPTATINTAQIDPANSEATL